MTSLDTGLVASARKPVISCKMAKLDKGDGFVPILARGRLTDSHEEDGNLKGSTSIDQAHPTSTNSQTIVSGDKKKQSDDHTYAVGNGRNGNQALKSTL